MDRLQYGDRPSPTQRRTLFIELHYLYPGRIDSSMEKDHIARDFYLYLGRIDSNMKTVHLFRATLSLDDLGRLDSNMET